MVTYKSKGRAFSQADFQEWVVGTLGEHSGVLDEHTMTLKEHSGTLEEHTEILREHTAILKEHGTILKEHSAILKEHSGILKEHGAILKEHSARLEKLERWLEKLNAQVSHIYELLRKMQADIQEIRVQQAEDRHIFLGMFEELRAMNIVNQKRLDQHDRLLGMKSTP